MVEGIYLEEKCKFGANLRFHFLWKTQAGLDLLTIQLRLSFGPRLQTEMTVAGAGVFFKR